MIKAAITGNYGMGKSSVLAVFEELGAAVMDSDAIVGLLLTEKSVIRRVDKILAGGVVGPNGMLDKKAVAEKIFKDPDLRRALESFLHPKVLKKVEEGIGKIKGEKSVVIIEVPLLFEGGYQDLFDKKITVYTSREVAIARLLAAGIPRTEAAARLRAQMPIAEKKKKSDYLIDNSGTKTQTRKQVEVVYELLKKQAGERGTKKPRNGHTA